MNRNFYNTYFVLWFLLLFIIQINGKAINTKTCTEYDDFSPVAHDCYKFLRCSNGMFYEFDCAPGTAFDYVRKICNFPDQVNCFTEQVPQTTKNMLTALTCSDPDGTIGGVPGNCLVFKQCNSGLLSFYNCEYGLYFDYIKQACVDPKDVICMPNKVISTQQVCTEADDYTGVIGDCTKFLRCANGEWFEFTCAPGTLFDYIRKVCDYPEKVTCLGPTLPQLTLATRITTTTQSVFETCTELDDYAGIPGECTKYKRCINGYLNIYVCEFGTYFDYIKRRCVDPTEVNCLEFPTKIIPEIITTRPIGIMTTRPIVTPSLSRPECTQNDDYSGVHGDCKKFLRCSNGKFVEFYCPPNTYFDYIRKICDKPELVRCADGTNPMTTRVYLTYSQQQASDGIRLTLELKSFILGLILFVGHFYYF